jgi:hypothetical protein
VENHVVKNGPQVVTCSGALQRQPAHKEDGEDDVGEEGREVDNFAGRLGKAFKNSISVKL